MAITLRSVKGTPLTSAEVDQNFTELQSYIGFRNKIINGNFDIWQRGTSFSPPPAGGFSADRWSNSNGTTGVTITRESFTAGQTDVPGEPTYFIRHVSSGASSQNLLGQKIEDVRTFAGKTVTLSFYIKGTPGQLIASTYPVIQQVFGTGGSATVSTSNPGSQIQLTGSWQKVVRTFTLPSISGKTIGTGSYIFVLPARADSVAFTFDLAQVQLEEGSVATPFETRPYGVELALCQRYYYRITANGIGNILATGYNNQTTTSQQFISFPITMRIAPTAIEQSGTATDYAILHSNSAVVCSAVPVIQSATVGGCRVTCTVAAGLTVGQGAMVYAATASAYFGFSAEL